MSKRTLAEAFEEHVAWLLGRVPVLPTEGAKAEGPDIEKDPIAYNFACAGIWRSSIGNDAPTIAGAIAEVVQRYADKLIPDSHVRAQVLADEELVDLWPLSTGIADKRIAHDAQCLFDVGGGSFGWHPRVSFEQAAEMLERAADDPNALRMAALVRAGAIPSIDAGQIPTPRKYPYEFGLDLPMVRLPPSAYGLNEASWDEVSADALVREVFGTRLQARDGTESSVEVKRLFAHLRLDRQWNPRAVAVLAYLEQKGSALAASQRSWLKMQWATSLAPEAKEDRSRIAADVIRASRDDAELASDAAAEELADLIRSHAAELGDRLGNAPTSEAAAMARANGILFADAALADYLETVGEGGKELARQVREKAAERSRKQDAGEIAPKGLWHLWLDEPRFARTLAKALWHDRVVPKLRRQRAKPAALVHAVYEPAAHLFSRVRREEERNGQRSLILPGDTVARIASSAAAIGSETINALMVDRGLKLFGSVTAHRVLRWQIYRAHQQALEGNPDPRVIRVDGGYAALTHDELGIKSKAEEGKVRDIIEAMHATELPMPPNNAYTRLLIRTAYPAQGRRPGRLELVLGTMLLPDYVQELQQVMGHSLQARSALRLVPVLPLPPFVGREREYGPQATLSMLLVAHIRAAGRELVEHGGAKLDTETLSRLAAASGLPTPIVPMLIDRWTQDGDDGPALLKRVDKDRFTLGDAHKAARDFIEEGCKREHAGSIGGKRSAAKRAKQIERLGRKGSRGR